MATRKATWSPDIEFRPPPLADRDPSTFIDKDTKNMYKLCVFAIYFCQIHTRGGR